MNTNERMNSTSFLVLTALITAMGTIATMFFKVPVGTGYIHLGDTMVLLAAMLLPRKHAIFAGSVGLCLADVLSGYAVWAPWSFFIKLVMVVIMQKALATAMEKGENNRHILGVPVPGNDRICYCRRVDRCRILHRRRHHLRKLDRSDAGRSVQCASGCSGCRSGRSDFSDAGPYRIRRILQLSQKIIGSSRMKAGQLLELSRFFGSLFIILPRNPSPRWWMFCHLFRRMRLRCPSGCR